MKLPNNNPIVSIFNNLLSNAGFEKKLNTWYCELEETILVINLQKSQYSYYYYTNLAIWIKIIGRAKFPKENFCHIRCRLDSLLPEGEQEFFEKVFNSENDSFQDWERKQAIEKFFNSYGFPFLRNCSTLAGISKAIKEDRLSDAIVSKELCDFV